MSVLASPWVSGSSTGSSRGLAVLADGVQAAFAAGAVAELARRGTRWDRGAGAGLGAHVGLLALLGDAAEAERRWLREGQLGCPMFESVLGAARRTLAAARGVAVAADPWSLPGWLDPAGLSEHLAPEMADMPQRLIRRGASLSVAVEDLRSGARGWFELAGVRPSRAGALLRAAAAFPGGWGPETGREEGAVECLWGGISAALHAPAPWDAGGAGWDVVCGFPVPAIARPAIGGSLLELLQRRSEIEGAARIAAVREALGQERFRVVAPSAAEYLAATGADGADLGVEYPLPWERNGGLTTALVRFGAHSVGARPPQPAA
jgi:hypothetical protein